MNKPYDQLRYRMLTAGLDWPLINVTLSAWGGTPYYDPLQKTVNDIKLAPGDHFEIASSAPNLHSSVLLNGTAVTDHMLFTNVPIGSQITWFTLSEVFGATNDSAKLLCFIDEGEFLPFLTNSLDIVVSPDWFFGRGWFRP